jgi:hypothetical protein
MNEFSNNANGTERWYIVPCTYTGERDTDVVETHSPFPAGSKTTDSDLKKTYRVRSVHIPAGI